MYSYVHVYICIHLSHSPAGNMLLVLYVKASMDDPRGASSAPCEGQPFDLPSPGNHGEYMENGTAKWIYFYVDEEIVMDQ